MTVYFYRTGPAEVDVSTKYKTDQTMDLESGNNVPAIILVESGAIAPASVAYRA